jgi:CRISPR-associated endoribonuclease Cas6
MLTALDIRLYPATDCTLPHPCGEWLHAAMLSLAAEHAPTLAARMHDGSRERPYALSTLWPRTRARGDGMTLTKYTACRFRFCALNDEAIETFVGPLYARLAARGSLRLGEMDFPLLSAEMAPPYGGQARYADLWQDIGDRALLRFRSPTTFHRQEKAYPLPDPDLVYGSLWRKWRAFSDLPVAEEIYQEMQAALALSRAAVRTRAWKFPRYLLTGFTGLAEFTLVRPVSPDARALFGALSTLAFYSGVGLRATMGLGECGRVMPEAPADA